MSSTKNYDLDLDTTLGGSSASDYIIPSQKAIKTYTDNSLTSYQLIAQDMPILTLVDNTSSPWVYRADDNKVYKLTPSTNISITLPTITDTSKLHQIFLQLTLSTVYTINVGTTYYFNKTAPDLSTTGSYNLYWEYDNTAGHWVCGCLAKGTAT